MIKRLLRATPAAWRHCCYEPGSNESARRRRRGGGVTLEFMMVCSVLMGLMMGIIQYSLVMFNLNGVEQVAREAARYAAGHGAENTADHGAHPPGPRIPNEHIRLC